MVEDPKLAEHLAHFGINIASMTKVRTGRRERKERGERNRRREHLAACIHTHVHIPIPSYPHTPPHPHPHILIPD